jgi:hypothetical protein
MYRQNPFSLGILDRKVGTHTYSKGSCPGIGLCLRYGKKSRTNPVCGSVFFFNFVMLLKWRSIMYLEKNGNIQSNYVLSSGKRKQKTFVASRAFFFPIFLK